MAKKEVEAVVNDVYNSAPAAKRDNRKLLTDEEIQSAISAVIHKKKKIDSQDTLVKLVVEELRKASPMALVSPQKARLLAAELPGVLVTVETKSSNKDLPEECPACKKKLKQLSAKNLAGRKIVVGIKCDNCKFYGSVKEFAPLKYTFELKK